MRFNHTAINYSKSCRVVYVICTILVLFYIFSDGLDLDESNLVSLENPEESAVISAELTAGLEPAGPSNAADFWENAALCADGSQECIHPQSLKPSRASPLDAARSHGYRVGLPRDAITDPFPLSVIVS